MRPAGKPGSKAGRLGFGSHKSGTATSRKNVGNRKVAIGPTKQNKHVRKRRAMGNVKVISAMRK